MQELENLSLEELELLTSPVQSPPQTPQRKKRAPRKATTPQKKTRHPRTSGTANGSGESDVAPEGLLDEKHFTPKEKRLKEDIFGLYMFLSFTLMPLSMGDALVISGSADKCAEAHILLGRKHKQYQTFLENLTTVSAYGAMATAHLPIIIGILTNHGMLPDVSTLFAAKPAPSTTEEGGINGNTANDTLFRNPTRVG